MNNENAVHSWNPWRPLKVNEGFTFPNSLFQNSMSFYSPKQSDTLFQGPAQPLATLGNGYITVKIYSYGPLILKCFGLGDKERGKQAKNTWCVHISCHTEQQIKKISIN